MIPQCNTDVLIEEIGDEVVAFAPGTGTSVVLNVTAAAILELSTGNHSITQIAEIIASALNANLDQVTTDVEALVQQLAVQGFVSLLDNNARD
ncbi:MAG: PqqD family protein [Chloroflexi bacterium]|nr:PqqD family protein [Chloroflexota bacterium]